MRYSSRFVARLAPFAALAAFGTALPLAIPPVAPLVTHAQSSQVGRSLSAELAQSSQVGRSLSAELTNDLQQFSAGKLQRTGLSTAKSSAASDSSGAVQLLPSAEITAWSEAGDLPEPRAEEAAVYLEYATSGTTKKGRIFVLGGRVGANDPQPAKSVLSAEVQQQVIVSGTATIDRRGELIIPTGQTNAWRAEPNLPTQVDNINSVIDPGTEGEVPERTNIAGASIAKPGGGGYIYAVGGLYSQINASLSDRSDLVSSPEVSIATVDAQGAITGWRNGRKLNIGDATISGDDVPLRSAQAIALTTQNGTPFLYVIGGVNQRFNGDAIELVGSDKVLRSQIDLATGDLGAWQQVATLPVRADTNSPDDTLVGVWDAGLAYTRYQPTSGAPIDTLLLIGGQARDATTGSDAKPAIFLSQVYQGTVAADGGVTFSPADKNAGTLTAAFSQQSVASYNSAVYVLGGVQSGASSPASAVQGSYLIDDPSGKPVLAKPGPSGSTSNFLRTDNLGPNKPRASHSTVVVPAGETKAYVYVIGGRGQNTAAEQDVFFGIIGGDQNATRFIPSGYFYSPTYNLVTLARNQGYAIESGKLKNLIWDTTMTQTLGHDVQLWYRTSQANSIDPGTAWIPITATLAPSGKGSIDGTTSVSGVPVNRASFGDVTARVIEFRAQLLSSAGTGTPLLRRVSLEFDVAGAPNLKFPDDPFTKVTTKLSNGKTALDNITVKISNKDTAELPLLDTKYSSDLTEFFVELYVNPTTSPPPFGTKGVAFARVKAEWLPKDTTIELKQWCSPNSPATGCTPFAISSLLQNTGTYTLYAYVDQLWPEEASGAPYGLIPETAGLPSAANEQDNVTLTPLTITIAPPDQIPADCVANPNQAQCPLAPDPEPTAKICPDPNDKYDITCTKPGGDGKIRLPMVMFKH